MFVFFSSRCLTTILLVLISSICVDYLNGHTVEICAEVAGTVVNFYAGTYHNDPADGSLFGAVLLSNGPQGNGRKEFTSVVVDNNETPNGVDLTNFDCARCSNYGSSGIQWWQYVQVSGLSNGVYDVTTSTDGSNVEDPYCTTFPSVTIANLQTAPPTPSPSPAPTQPPTRTPSRSPSYSPSRTPSDSPTRVPSRTPSYSPTRSPSDSPTRTPSRTPSYSPTRTPSDSPSDAPSRTPSDAPSRVPSRVPSRTPSRVPSFSPTRVPTQAPSITPTLAPSTVPSRVPTLAPSITPTLAPSTVPSRTPSRMPTEAPSIAPTEAPSIAPTTVPSDSPSRVPSIAPSDAPSRVPSDTPSRVPTNVPTSAPSLAPTDSPTFNSLFCTTRQTFYNFPSWNYNLQNDMTSMSINENNNNDNNDIWIKFYDYNKANNQWMLKISTRFNIFPKYSDIYDDNGKIGEFMTKINLDLSYYQYYDAAPNLKNPIFAISDDHFYIALKIKGMLFLDELSDFLVCKSTQKCSKYNVQVFLFACTRVLKKSNLNVLKCSFKCRPVSTFSFSWCILLFCLFFLFG